MSVKKQPRKKRDYHSALSNPGPFIIKHLARSATPLTQVSVLTGVPYSTLRNILAGRKPGLSMVSAAQHLRFVLKERGESTDTGAQE